MSIERRNQIWEDVSGWLGVGHHIGVEDEIDKDSWESQMIGVMKENSDSNAEFSFKVIGRKTVFTRVSNGYKKEKIAVTKVSNGDSENVGVGSGWVWESLEVKKKDYDRCQWFADALKEHRIKTYLVEKTKSGEVKTELSFAA